MSQAICTVCGQRGPMTSPGPGDRRWCTARFCGGEMIEDHSEPVVIAVQSTVTPQGEVVVVARFATDEETAIALLEIPEPARIAIAAMCDHADTLAQALDLLGFREGGDLFRGAAKKIRLKAAPKTG